MYVAGYKLKRKKADFKHDLSFYCIHNQLSMLLYKVKVQSTWDI